MIKMYKKKLTLFSLMNYSTLGKDDGMPVVSDKIH